MRHLFLTGPQGCGKSTSIAAALGADLTRAGGFLTVRQLGENGQAVGYFLQRPDGQDAQCILDYTQTPGVMHLEVFEGLGIRLMEQAQSYPYIVLDEFGGFELLSDRVQEALMTLLRSDIPCIGVMKGAGSASKMIRRLGLGEKYTQRAEAMREWMRRDPDTLLYECNQFDPKGLALARQWVQTYVRPETKNREVT